MTWFPNISPEQWEHISYFLAGVVFSGVSSGIIFVLNQWALVREIMNSDRKVQL
jgi:hypothetical protein